MVPLINEAADSMLNYLSSLPTVADQEVKEVTSKFATDVLTSTAFGLKTKSFLGEDAGFTEIGRKLFALSYRNWVAQITSFFLPWLKLLRTPVVDPKLHDFLKDVLLEVVEERMKGDVKRNDVIDTVIKMKQSTSENDAFIGEQRFSFQI